MVNLSTCLKTITRKDIRGCENKAPFRASDGGEWSALRSGGLTPGERSRGTYLVEGSVRPGDDLKAMAKRNIFALPGIEHRSSS
jgi:hypothetical protein